MKTQYQYLILAVTLCIVGSSGCNQFENFTNFTLTYEQDAKVESSTGINLPFNIATPQMETNSEAEFENNNTEKKYIKSIELDQLSITLTDPPEEDFSFLESISVYIKAEGLDELRVAWKDPVSEQTSNVLNLDCSDSDLKEYIKKDRFSLRLAVSTDEFIAKDHYFKIKSVYFVSAQLKEE